tara:strand:+ start:1100 stop:2530 length:1431 start_codon:yes stop_codon:yes gene_type:complete
LRLFKNFKMSSLNENLSKLESINFSGFTDNSTFVESNFIFLSFTENLNDALKHSRDALNRGAILVISQVDLSEEIKEKNIYDSNLENHKDKYLKALFNRSEKDIKVIGITGTNGKSSTAFFLHQLLSFTDLNATLLTNMHKVSDLENSELSPLTTPDKFLLHHYLKKSIDLKRDYFLMEVSSHAIDQGRICGLNFIAKSLTSFSQDHLDYHKNLEVYKETKKSFFNQADKNNVVSIDCDLGEELASENNSILTVSVKKKKANLFLESNLIKTPWGDLENFLPFKSEPMVSNFLCALGLYGKISGGIDLEPDMLKDLKTLPGRLQRVSLFENKFSYIDYAHSPDAISSVLDYLKNRYKGKIITIFGCGGERDTLKREEMGKIVEEKSHFQIITNDNPRNEDPDEIIYEIKKGMNSKNHEIILDRKKAILEGLKKLKTSEPDSVLLIAGKGHENFQVIKDQEIHFNDLEVLKELKNVI